MNHRFIHRKLTKFLKKTYQLGMKRETDKLKKVISTTKQLQAGNRLRSLPSCKYQPYPIEKEGWLERQNQDSTQWGQELWRTTDGEYDWAQSREKVLCVRPDFRIWWTSDCFMPPIFSLSECKYPLWLLPFNVGSVLIDDLVSSQASRTKRIYPQNYNWGSLSTLKWI